MSVPHVATSAPLSPDLFELLKAIRHSNLNWRAMILDLSYREVKELKSELTDVRTYLIELDSFIK